jgi:hypothetical protein
MGGTSLQTKMKRRIGLPLDGTFSEWPHAGGNPPGLSNMKNFLKAFYLLPVMVVVGVVGYLVWNHSHAPAAHVMSGRPFAGVSISNLTANLFTPGEQLGPAANDVFIEFRDGAGKLEDVGDVQFELGMETPGAVMHSIFKVLRTSTAGQYRANVVPEIAGEWKAKLRFNGRNGRGEADFAVRVK